MRTLFFLVLFTSRALAQAGTDPGPPLPPEPGPPLPPTQPAQPAQPQQPVQPTPPLVAYEQPEPKLWIGPQLDLMPVGSLHVSAFGVGGSDDASTAFGIGGLLDYRVHRLISIGAAPRFVTPVKTEVATESGSQFDLRARVTIGGHVAPRVRMFGIGTLGYSWLFNVVKDMTGKDRTGSGVIFGLGGGVAFAIRPRMLLLGEMSYQWGDQSATVSSVEIVAKDRYLSLGLGMAAAID